MPSESDSKTLVGRSLGRYQLVRVLGRGAMGMVYEGLDTRLGRTVAIKTVLRSFLADDNTAADYAVRFEREAQAAARLNHPNIVALFDFGEQEDVSYIVMEFIRGRELAETFKAGERFTPQQTLRLMTELLDALGAAHDSGIIHRDVKPANVLIDESGRVKLADFGVARVVEPNQDRTLPGTMVGTPSAMAPEQILGQAVGSRTDIFSAGLIFYQLLTGKRPFAGSGPFGVQRAIVHDEPMPPSALNPELPAAVDAVLAKALAKAPAHRYNSAAAFSAAVAAALGPVVPGGLAVHGSTQDALDPDMTVVLPKRAPQVPASPAQDTLRTPGPADSAVPVVAPGLPTPLAPHPVPVALGQAGALQDDATEFRPGSVVPPPMADQTTGAIGRSGVGLEPVPTLSRAAPPPVSLTGSGDIAGFAVQMPVAPVADAAPAAQTAAVAAPVPAPVQVSVMAPVPTPVSSPTPRSAALPAPAGRSLWPAVAVAAAVGLGVALWWTQLRTTDATLVADPAPASAGASPSSAQPAGASVANVTTEAVPLPSSTAPVATAAAPEVAPRPAAPPAIPPVASPGRSAATPPGPMPGVIPSARAPVPGTGAATLPPQVRTAAAGAPPSTPPGTLPGLSNTTAAAPGGYAAATAPAQVSVPAGGQTSGYGSSTPPTAAATDSVGTPSTAAVAPAAGSVTANPGAAPVAAAKPAAPSAGAETTTPTVTQAPREAERKLGPNHPRCVELRSRILLGDTLTPEQTTMFHTRCAR